MNQLYYVPLILSGIVCWQSVVWGLLFVGTFLRVTVGLHAPGCQLGDASLGNTCFETTGRFDE